MHIYREYRRYVYGAVFFLCGLTLGLSNLLFDGSDDTSGNAYEIAAKPPTGENFTNNSQVGNDSGMESDSDIAASIERAAENDENFEVTQEDGPTFSNTPIPGIENASTTEIVMKEIRIKRGQGLMDALMDGGVERQQAYNAINALSEEFNVRRIQVGQIINLSLGANGILERLEMQKDFDHVIVVKRDTDSYKSATETLSSQIITRHASGIIEDSLFLAAQRQGLPQIVIVDLIRIFSYDVDFQREIRKGDQFEIFYERKLSQDGRRVQEGNILYAKLTLSGKDIGLYRHIPDGKNFADYFHEDGQSSKRALMKTPIEGARLSSYYGNRRHPVLGYNRLHKGVDFSAPTGTPIMAAGDGVVERASWFGSFGNYVRIRHNSTYKTVYAHMSKYGRGIKKGVRVRQRQNIGYVGATGRVTGRHLHYEVHMNGKAINPLTLKIPSGIKLTDEQLEKFQLAMEDTNRMIAQAKSHILLTQNTSVDLANNSNP